VEQESSAGYVLILIDMINTIGIKSTGPTDKAMDLVAFFQEEFGKVAPILTRNAGY
jgi:aromatic ring-cleaving dioxygenase